MKPIELGHLEKKKRGTGTLNQHMLTSLFKTRSSVKYLASIPNGSGETSIDAEETASLCADVKGALGSEASPFCSSEFSPFSTTVSDAALLPIDGA